LALQSAAGWAAAAWSAEPWTRPAWAAAMTTTQSRSGLARAMAAAADVDSEDMEDDLSAGGKIAQRIRAELAAVVPLPAATFRIRDTGGERGMGLFAATWIASGVYMFDYHGEQLEQAEFTRRYPAGGKPAEYVVAVERSDGSTAYTDAVEPWRENLARYMNHLGTAPNCAMWTLADAKPAPRMLLFTKEDIAPGDELCWDYGDAYWQDRNDLVE